MRSIAALYHSLYLSKSTDPTGYSIMECASFMAGEPRSVTPDCACPVLSTFATCTNDAMDDAKRQALRPILLHLAACRASEGAETARLVCLFDFVLNIYLPRLLPDVGLQHLAEQFKGVHASIAAGRLLDAISSLNKLLMEMAGRMRPTEGLQVMAADGSSDTAKVSQEAFFKALVSLTKALMALQAGNRVDATINLSAVFHACEQQATRVDALLRMLVVDRQPALDKSDEVLETLAQLVELAKKPA